MCFSIEMSTAAAALGLVNCLWVWYCTRNKCLLSCCFYFFLMEVLQVAQYLVADQCESQLNQLLTVLGWLHIAFQPVFSNLAAFSFARGKPSLRHDMWFAVKLSIVGGLFLSSRIFLSHLNPPGIGHHAVEAQWEWFQGTKTCSFIGPNHIAWEAPLLAPSYWVPATFLHKFLMFVPLIITDTIFIPDAVALYVFGPVLAALITSNLYEQPAIWCFFSVTQICVFFNVRLWKMGWTVPENHSAVAEAKKAK